MKLATYNVNGMRAAMRKGLVEWVAAEQPDLLCLQEVKALPHEVDTAPFEELGYQAFWHPAQKKGYSGVATFTRIAPTHVEVGCGMDAYDAEGRVLTTHLPNGEVVLNVYMPSGTSGDERQTFKYQWLADFLPYAKNLATKHSKLIICGDFNIAHTEMDIKNAASNKNSSGFLPEERAWLTSFLEAGFTDTFRAINPDKQEYSWWTFRAGARERNIGWRIDYIMTTQALRDSLKHARMAPEAVHSDHCPVILEWN